MDKIPVNYDIKDQINNTEKIPKKGKIPVLKYYMMVILGL